ncbi:recombination protein RecR [Candidatus Falkowbacteria bacterium]|nr:recombination protein RecR [Candidatus Falkowbacteria bacterium]
MNNEQSITNKLINAFSALPGVGRKTAERFVFFLLKQPKEFLENFGADLKELPNHNFFCPQCFNYSEARTVCPVCADSKRDRAAICVVENFHDLNVIEATKEYNGLYHCLGGKIDPPEGITPDKLRVKELLERIQNDHIQEVILALNPDLSGEGTIIYLKKILAPLNVKISLLARGLPMGGEIEYADEVTLANAIKGRRILN